MKADGTQKVKSTVLELLELERLIAEFNKLKARQAELIRRLGTPQEALVAIENDLTRIQRRLYARDPYTNPRHYINWN